MFNDPHYEKRHAEALSNKLVKIIGTLIRASALKENEKALEMKFNPKGDFDNNPTGWHVEKVGDKVVVHFPQKDVMELSYSGFLDALLSTIARRRYLQTGPKMEREVATYMTETGEEPYAESLVFCLNVLIEMYGKNKMVKEFPGTTDAFRESIRGFDKASSEKLFSEMSPIENYLMNLERVFWNLEVLGANEKVEDAFIETLNEVDALFKAQNSAEFISAYLGKLWPKIKELIPQGSGGFPAPQQTFASLADMKEKMVLQQALEKKSGSQMKLGAPTPESKPEEGDVSDTDENAQDNSPQQGQGQTTTDTPENSTGASSEAQDEAIQSLKDVLEGMVAQENMGVADQKEMMKMMADRQAAHLSILDANEQPAAGVGKYQRIEDTPPYWELLGQVKQYAGVFQKKLNNILKDNRLTRNGGSYRSGTLSKNKLYKIMTRTDKLFTRKVNRRFKNYAVTLLADSSGSMMGEPMRQVGLSCVLMAEVLNKIGVDFEIMTFDYEIRYLKTFKQKFDWNIKRNLELLHNNGICGGGTNMEGAINEAVHRLRLQDADKRILVLLTDGEPCSSGRLPDKMIARLRKQGRRETDFGHFRMGTEIAAAKQEVTVIGVGIGNMTGYLKKFLEDTEILTDVSKLPGVILKKLRRYIKRG